MYKFDISTPWAVTDSDVFIKKLDIS